LRIEQIKSFETKPPIVKPIIKIMSYFNYFTLENIIVESNYGTTGMKRVAYENEKFKYIQESEVIFREKRKY